MARKRKNETYQQTDSTQPRVAKTANAVDAVARAVKYSNPATSWYRGDKPTSSETLARMYTVSGDDQVKWDSLYSQYQSERATYGSPIYNPYTQATAKGAQAKSNADKAEKELAQLNRAVTWYAGKGYSDDEIRRKVQGKYSTLAKMDEGRLSGNPYKLDRAIDYDEDYISSVAWQARNGGGSGDRLTDGVRAALGQGNQYQRNGRKESRRNPTSKAYQPYAEATTDDLCMYFGVDKIGQDWVNQNRDQAMQEGVDSEFYQNWAQAYKAVKTTELAQSEYADLMDTVNKRLKGSTDPEKVLAELKDSYPTLAKMDEGRYLGTPLELTDAVIYRWEDVERYVKNRCAAAQAKAEGREDPLHVNWTEANHAAAQNTPAPQTDQQAETPAQQDNQPDVLGWLGDQLLKAKGIRRPEEAAQGEQPAPEQPEALQPAEQEAQAPTQQPEAQTEQPKQAAPSNTSPQQQQQPQPQPAAQVTDEMVKEYAAQMHMPEAEARKQLEEMTAQAQTEAEEQVQPQLSAGKASDQQGQKNHTYTPGEIAMSAITTPLKGFYDMTLGNITGPWDWLQETSKDKSGTSAGNVALAGVLSAGGATNDAALGVAENAVEWSKGLLNLFGVQTSKQNVYTDLREKNAAALSRTAGELMKDATALQQIAANVISSSINSSFLMMAGTAASGAVGQAMGGGVGTVNAALRTNQITNAAGMTQMAPFALQSATEAYDSAEAQGLSAWQAATSAVCAGLMSLATNGDAYESYVDRLGIGYRTSADMLAGMTATKLSGFGERAYQFITDMLTDMAPKEGLQEVAESFAMKLNSDMWNGTFFDDTGWKEWSAGAKQDFYYGYLSGALFYVSALPSYAKSSMMLDAMASGQTKPTPEEMTSFIEQVAQDYSSPEMRAQAEQTLQQANAAVETASDSARETLKDALVDYCAGKKDVSEQERQVIANAARGPYAAILNPEEDRTQLGETANRVLNSLESGYAEAADRAEGYYRLMEDMTEAATQGMSLEEYYAAFPDEQQTVMSYVTAAESMKEARREAMRQSEQERRVQFVQLVGQTQSRMAKGEALSQQESELLARVDGQELNGRSVNDEAYASARAELERRYAQAENAQDVLTGEAALDMLDSTARLAQASGYSGIGEYYADNPNAQQSPETIWERAAKQQSLSASDAAQSTEISRALTDGTMNTPEMEAQQTAAAQAENMRVQAEQALSTLTQASQEANARLESANQAMMENATPEAVKDYQQAVQSVASMGAQLKKAQESHMQAEQAARQENGKLAQLRREQLDMIRSAAQERTMAMAISQEEGIVPFSEHEAQNLTSAKGVAAGGSMSFKDFIQKAIQGALGTIRRFYLGKLSQKTASEITDSTGFDLSGYSVMIRSDEVKHILDEHGSQAEYDRGQIPVTPSAIELVGDVIAAPDSVKISAGKDYAGRTALEFEKEIGGKHVVVAGITTGGKLLTVDTLYILNTKKKPFPTSNAAAAASDITSETGRELASDNSISWKTENVNAQNMENELRAAAAEPLTDAAEVYGVKGAAQKVMAEAYDGSTDAESYAKGFAKAYHQGQLGLAFDGVQQSAGLTEQQARAAYDQGMKEYTSHKGKGGVVRAYTKDGLRAVGDKAAQKQARTEIRVLDAIGKRYGLKMVVENDLGNADGYYDNRDQTLHLSLAHKDPFLFTAIHELTHGAEHSESYGALEQFVVDNIGTELAGQRALEIAQSYQKHGVELSPAEALQEVVANALPSILSDEKTVRELVKGDRTLAEHIRDFFADFWENVQRALDRLTFDDGQYPEYLAMAASGNVKKAWELLDKALMEGKGENSGGKQYSLSGVNPSSHYDYSKPFAAQVDDWITGKIPKNDSLMLGGTPEIYQKIGLSKLPMTIDQTHVDYAVNGTKNADHHMGADMLKRLPELLADPVAIISSETRPDDSVVAIVSTTVNGHQMMAAIEVGGVGFANGEALDVNVISTAQGRKNTITKLLVNAMQKENADGVGVYYIKKSEARSLSGFAGVQFPGVTVQDGLIHSIFDAGSPVNRKFKEQTETLQFKRWFGESKVVDEDGAPKMMYHGSEWNPLSEAPGKAEFRDESYFTANPEYAKQYAQENGTVSPVYLSIQHPFDIRDGEAKKIYDEFRQGHEAATTPSGAIDWAEFEFDDLKDFLDENYPGQYDGFVLDEGGAPNADGTRVRGVSYVPFDATQIKSATDNIGTFDGQNPDIRYSISPKSEMDTLHDELMQAREQGEDERPNVRNLASNALKNAGSRYNRGTFAQEIQSVFDYLQSETDPDIETAMTMLTDTCKAALEKSAHQDTAHAEYVRAARDYLRGTRIKLNEGQRAEAANQYGSYNAYRRELFGNLRLTNDGIELDSAWQELSEMNPALFPPDTNEADMPAVLAAAVQAMKPRTLNDYAYNMDGAAHDMAMGLLEDYFGLDKAREQTEAQRQESRESFESALNGYDEDTPENRAMILRDQYLTGRGMEPTALWGGGGSGGGGLPPSTNVGGGARMGKRQFANQTAQRSEAMPDWLKAELRNNPAESDYETQTNYEQAQQGWERIQTDGYEATRDRLLGLERFSSVDTATANVLMAQAFHNGDAETALAVASKYNREGTKAGQELQARKLFERMSPTQARVFVAGQMENQFHDWREAHRPADAHYQEQAQAVTEDIARLTAGETDGGSNRWQVELNEQQRALIDRYGLQNVNRPGLQYNRATTQQRMLEAILATPSPTALTGGGLSLIDRLEYMSHGLAVVTNADLDYIGMNLARFVAGGGESGGREADMAISRAYEAFGNITPETRRNKLRTWRYMSMLTSLPTSTRNVMGNAFQGVNNATAHGIAAGLDAVIGRFTGQRTVTMNTMQERAAGWQAYVEETKNTFLDYFVDKTITQREDSKFNTNQRGRVYQTGALEQMRNLEGFLMSVGDRNVWRKNYVQSLSEQQRLNAMNGNHATAEQMHEQAVADANYSTFTEDNAVRDAINGLKRIPGVGDVLDFIMPFTGVPTNITKRMIEFSPIGLAWTCVRHGANALTGHTFDQRGFVMGLARGLTGTGLFAVGMALGSLGMIRLGTSDDDDTKKKDVRAANGDQYSPYILNPFTGEYVSLAIAAPAVSPLIMGTVANKLFSEDENVLNALASAVCASVDQIFDASYLSSLQDIFNNQSGDSFTENAIKVTASSAVSQNIPAVLNQLATALDPYVRDVRDKDYIQNMLKTAMSKIPGLREMLPEKVDITGQPVLSKEGLRNFIDPFYTTKAKDDAALNELLRLSELAGESDFLPADALRGNRNTISGAARELTDTEKESYKKKYGSLYFDGGSTLDANGNAVTVTGLRQLMASEAYQSMSDAEKIGAIKGIGASAKAGAKAEALQAVGAAPKEQTLSDGYTKKPMAAMPEKFASVDAPYMQELKTRLDRTGDGAFVPTAISGSFSRDKVQYSLTGTDMDDLWQMYMDELETAMVKVDWTASDEETGAAVSKAYSDAQKKAKDRWAKER